MITGMWTIKVFRTRKAMMDFVSRHAGRIEWHEVFVNNAYAIEYRKLIRVY